MLARATARLGRDSTANALFARLGSAALQSEDLFLLGLGLSRSGQAEKAERVWERALAKDSEHAETLEQLSGSTQREIGWPRRLCWPSGFRGSRAGSCGAS